MNKKIIKVILVSLVLVFIFNINFALAENPFGEPCSTKSFTDLKGAICYEPEIAIPGLPSSFEVESNTLGLYIKIWYEYLLYVAGVLAVIVVMVGGFQWITAGGNQSKIGEAKERIISAIIGLFLALGSYLLLYTINPELVKIHDLNMPDIEPINIYCEDVSKLRKVGDTGEYTIDGSETECGEYYEYVVDESIFKCRGRSCFKEGASYVCKIDKCVNESVSYNHPCDDNKDSDCIPPNVCKSYAARQDGGTGLCGLRSGQDGYCSEDLDCVEDYSCISSRCKHDVSGLCEGLSPGDTCVNSEENGYCNNQLACFACASVGDNCGSPHGPQYVCPNPQGICGSNNGGDYCDSWSNLCTENDNPGLLH